jgi:homoserine dehydrogenase
MVDRAHPLADVSGADNAVLVEAADAGPLLFRGAGAGGVPTSSAVIGDLVTAGRRRLLGHYDAAPAAATPECPGPLPGPRTRYHLRVPVGDGTTALAEVTAALRNEGVRIDSVQQRRAPGDEALVLLTEDTDEAALRAAVAAVAALPSVGAAPRFMRLLDAEERR